jgi:hypothetical protein
MEINKYPEIIGRRITPEIIDKLNDDEIFVFGSNKSGIMGAGAAKIAYQRFGAVWGVGEGVTGECYAIPTKDYGIRRTLRIDEIKPFVDEFIQFAKNNDDFIFLVTKIGCGLAGYRSNDIAPLFKDAEDIKNIYLPLDFWEVLEG